jgi:hypothetical protein
MSTHRLRRALVGALVTLSAAIGVAVPATAATHARHVTHHRPTHQAIPQHGGGDHDADNFGGPSDGDGNL